MGRCMALRTFGVLPELPLCPLPRFRIKDGGHRDSNPLARWPPGPALRIPRDTVFATAPAIRLVRLPRLGAIVIGFALVEGVTEDLDNTTLGPAPMARRAGDNPLGREPSLDGIGTHLFLHAPAIDEVDHFGFGLVDDEMLRGCRGFPDVRVVIGGIPPVDPPLPRRKQAATARSFLNQCPLVLGKDALHLEQ